MGVVVRDVAIMLLASVAAAVGVTTAASQRGEGDEHTGHVISKADLQMAPEISAKQLARTPGADWLTVNGNLGQQRSGCSPGHFSRW